MWSVLATIIFLFITLIEKDWPSTTYYIILRVILFLLIVLLTFKGHLASDSVKRVIVTAPSTDIPMMIIGVNEDKISTGYDLLHLWLFVKILNDTI